HGPQHTRFHHERNMPPHLAAHRRRGGSLSSTAMYEGHGISRFLCRALSVCQMCANHPKPQARRRFSAGFKSRKNRDLAHISLENPKSRALENKPRNLAVSRLFNLVGQAGFEPTTPSPPVKCATRLRYCPRKSARRICPAGGGSAPKGWRTILSSAVNGNARYQLRALFFSRAPRGARPFGPMSAEQLFQRLQIRKNEP